MNRFRDNGCQREALSTTVDLRKRKPHFRSRGGTPAAIATKRQTDRQTDRQRANSISPTTTGR